MYQLWPYSKIRLFGKVHIKVNTVHAAVAAQVVKLHSDACR